MTFRLHLAAAPSIEWDSAVPLALGKRDAAMLAWLAVEGPTSRDRLGELLWPASTSAQARTTLRQRLFRLKKVLGIDVVVGAQVLELAEGVSHDLAESTSLLGDLTLADSPELDAWLAGQREQRRTREVEALREQAQALADAGDTAAALRVAMAVRRLAPTSELAHQRLIQLHYLAGDRAAALAAFDECEQMLKHELGTTPSPQTLALLGTVERAGAAPSALRRELPASVLRPPRMVGRERELAALAQAWDGAKVAAVVGEAGMGKSRLLAEFAAAPGGIVVAQARPGDSGVPFATLARLLREIGRCHTPPPLPEDERLQLARVLPELVTTGTVFQEGQRLRLQRALVRYIASAPGLRGLVLDDLHFADTASLEMLPALLAGTPAARWALAFRPAEAGSALHALQDTLAETLQLQLVQLAPLSVVELAELVDDLQLGLEGRAIAPALHKRTGGNPLFLLETLKQAWVENAVATLQDDATHLPRAQTVERLIDRRIAQLSPAALALARVAAIAGVDFSLDLAETVLGTPALLLADALHELEAAQVLKGAQFAHDLVFDAALRSVPAALAEHVHGKVAAWLDGNRGEPARVAAHWIAASRPERARDWLQRAVKASMHAFRWQEALGFLTHRAEIDESLGEFDAAFEARLEAVKLSGEVCGLRETLAQCDQLSAAARNDGQRARAGIERANRLTHGGRCAESEQASRAARDQAVKLNDIDLVRSCDIALLGALVIQRRADEALPLAESCRRWIDGWPDREERLHFYNACLMLYENLGRCTEAQRDGEQALKLCDDHSDEVSRITILGNLASNVIRTGRLRQAASLRREALGLASRFDGSLHSASIIQLNLSSVLVRLGEFSEGLDLLDAAEATLTARAPPLAAYAVMFRGWAWLHLGQFARARQAALDALARAEAPPEVHIRAGLLAHELQRASHLVWEGRAPLDAVAERLKGIALTGSSFSLQIAQAGGLADLQALVSLEDLRERARRGEQMGIVLEGHVQSARIAATTDPAVAMRHVEAALALSATFDLVYSYRAEFWLHLGRALLAAGHAERALHLVAEGAEWVRRTARLHVPEPFRDSFLHRNPVNVELLALAGELGRGAA